MAYDRRALVGVGGWLAFFVISLWLTAAGSLIMTLATLLQLGAAPQSGTIRGFHVYLFALGLLGICQSAAFAYMAWRMNARDDTGTPSLVIRLLWAAVLLPPLLDVLAAAALLDVDATRAGEALGAQIVRPLVYAAIWTAYLRRSERVANTYTRNGAADQLAAVFE